jgi:hypothetical protein
MIETQERTTQEDEHSIRGYRLEGRAMQRATDKVQDFLNDKDAPELFTPDERVYADITLDLLAERAQNLQQEGEKGVMGLAFDDAYKHLRGIASEAEAEADTKTLNQARNAHAAGESAAVKLDALLNAAHQGRGFGEAVEYIHALPEEEVTEEQKTARQIVDAIPADQRRAYAAALMADLFGTKK